VAERLQADVAVIGAGPAGIAAACVAAEAGRRVVLIDEGPKPGGQIWRHRETAPGPARPWLARLHAAPGVTRLGAATVFDADTRTLHVEQAGRGLRVQAAVRVVATGARERFLPFPGWTLPGVIGVGAAQALLKSGASFAGRRVLVSGTGPLLLPVGAALATGGAHVSLVAEQAPFASVARFGLGLWREPGKLRDAVRYRLRLGSTSYRTGAWVVEALGAGAVEAVVLSNGRRTWQERCDVLCCAYGLVPNTELAQLLGCRLADGLVAADEWQATSVAAVFVAGEPAGIAGLDQALVTGQIAGLAASGKRDAARGLFAARAAGRAFAARLAACFELRAELRQLARADTLVCRCEDVSFEQVASAPTRRVAKLRTRAGMGACQGRICGPALEWLLGMESDTVRPPLVPVPIGLMEED
jgi:D-hydroxyproline dehydrogenase subunit alpha